jgi:hypothetical protein
MTWKDVLTGPCLYRNTSAVFAACGTTERLLVLALKQRWRASTLHPAIAAVSQHSWTREPAMRHLVRCTWSAGHALPAIRAQSIPILCDQQHERISTENSSRATSGHGEKGCARTGIVGGCYSRLVDRLAGGVVDIWS